MGTKICTWASLVLFAAALLVPATASGQDDAWVPEPSDQPPARVAVITVLAILGGLALITIPLVIVAHRANSVHGSLRQMRRRYFESCRRHEHAVRRPAGSGGGAAEI